jgi:hypothetical protein
MYVDDGWGISTEGGNPMPQFIPGLRLSERFYREAVKPILDAHFPHLRYSAGLLGSGSEVLGYDTLLSTDHHWGPRLFLFLSEDDIERYGPAITTCLGERLPHHIHGYSTNFGQPDEIGVQFREEIASGPVNHWVRPTTIHSFVESLLGTDPHGAITALDWLTFPEQRLLELTAGAVYHDGLGELNAVRERFAYYPRDVWLYQLAAQWKRISQEEAFMGRCGDVGDELGSRIVAARLVRDLMRLCFLMERAYAPYSKWFGTAFARLRCAGELGPVFSSVLSAAAWRERERSLSTAYRVVARMHNALGITGPLDERVSPYHSRPYLVINAVRFAEAIRESITSDEVRRITVDIGAVDQFADSTDLTAKARLCRKLRVLYE